jgi:protein involved in polysaccharide export with SLBB domain
MTVKSQTTKLLFYTTALAILAIAPQVINQNKELVRAATEKVVSPLGWLSIDLLPGGGRSDGGREPAVTAEKSVQLAGATDLARETPVSAAPVIPEGCARVEAGRGRAVTGDRVQLRIFEPVAADAGSAPVLGPARGAFERLDLGGIYEIDDAGQLGLPLLGRIDAQGQTLRCIEAAVALRFFDVSHATASVSASFAARPPIVVNGAVRSPGSYAATPGMTLEALLAAAGAKAGGSEGSAGEAANLLDRRAELERVALGLTLSIGRLEAAQAGATTVRLDEAVRRRLLATLGERRLDTEIEMLRTSVATDVAAVMAAGTALDGYDKRIAEAERRLSAISDQVGRRNQRLDEFVGLQQRGVTTATRVEDLEFGALALERERLAASAELTLLRAQREADMRRARLAAAERRENRQSELLLLLQQKQSIEAEIATIEARLGRSPLADNGMAGLELSITVHRASPAGIVELEGDPSMPVLPGDIVLVGLSSAEAVALSQSRPSVRAQAAAGQVTR